MNRPFTVKHTIPEGEASLIAAAPQLLNAARQAEALLSEVLSVGINGTWELATLDELRTAIAAADTKEPLMQPSAPITVTAAELAAAFTEWDRRYREEPERFMSEAQHLLKETPESYGEATAPYFMTMLEEVHKPALPPRAAVFIGTTNEADYSPRG